jgi:hypothetical protein
MGGAPMGSRNNPKGTKKPTMVGNKNATKPKQNQNKTKTIAINREIDNREIDNNRATPIPQTAKRDGAPIA